MFFTEDENGRWGINVDTNGVIVFHECFVDPAVPDTLTHLVRSCSGKSTINTCPKDYSKNNATVSELCESYTAMVFEPNAAYRNVHCAICNNASLDKLICLNLGPFGRFNWQQNFNSFSFAVLFDLSGDVEDKIGHIQCQNGAIFDPFFRKCRNVLCGQDGMEFRNGRCLDTRIPPPITTTALTTTTTQTTTTFFTTKPATTRFAFTITSTSTSTTTSKSLPNTTSENPSPITTTLSSISTTASSINLVEASTSTSKPLTTASTTQSSTSTSTSTTSSNAEFKDCPKFELQVGEFKMMEEEHSVYVEKYDRVLAPGQFSLKGNNLVICVTQQATSELEGQISKFGPQMGYVTFVGLGISIICLLLHISASFLTAELQNLSGKNLLSLSFALLGGYITFLAGMFKPATVFDGNSCKILAISMYFFYLSSFFWMMIIAFDVCKTLKMATTQLRLTTGTQWRKFALYSTLAWGVPMALVTIVSIMDHVEAVPQAYRPGFGDTNLCWFSNKMALLIYFAVPFAGIMGLNMFLFVFSACMVFDTTRSTSKMTTNPCSPQTNFYLYLRLAVIMGLTWIIGLVAGFVDKEPVWYVFIVLNTLQGLFIFVAFTCTKKVRDGVKSALCGQNNNRRHADLDDRHFGAGGTWKFSSSKDGTSSSNATKKSHLDLSNPSNVTNSSMTSSMTSSPPTSAPPVDAAIPSRYGPRSKTMYTVSKQHVSGVTQNSFNGRYY